MSINFYLILTLNIVISMFIIVLKKVINQGECKIILQLC